MKYNNTPDIFPINNMSSTEHQQIRYAAETIYRHIQQPQYTHSRYDSSRSHAQLEILNAITEDYIAGYMQDGRMSVVRRFFCLFVAFDLFFISLLWLICIMMNGDTMVNALRVQVLHYTIQSSLFDIVFAAIVRFFCLITFYGIFSINHWIVIALTTSGSCSFLIGKVFYYNWLVTAQPIIQVLLIIVSCLLAWGEAWFLDCRVIPQEKNAQRFYRAFMSDTEQDERSPLLGPYLSAVRGGTETSIANFYSPIESAHNSDIEDDQYDEFRAIGIGNVKNAYELLNATDWKIERTNEATGDCIQSVQRKNTGKIFRLTARLHFPAKQLLLKLFYDVEKIPKWNPTVLESKILKKIDKYTDITYQVSAPGGGGLVASRDFVNLRCWKVIKNGNIFDEDLEDSNDPQLDEPQPYSQTISSSTSNVHRLRKSASAIDLNNDIADVKKKTLLHSLSKSLGAKVFADESAEQRIDFSSDSNDLDQEQDLFVDAKETQSTTTMSVQSVTSPEQSENNSSDKMYVLTSVSVTYDRMPRVSKYTRGENLVGCCAIRESKSQPGVCVFDWLLCLDLKGLFLRSVLDRAYTNVMQEFMAHLRQYCNDIEDDVDN